MNESKTPTQFRKGDRVDFTVRGARVDGVADDLNLLALNLTPDDPKGSVQALDLPLAENVEVAHAAPADWPPQLGDVWRSKQSGERFFAATDTRGCVGIDDGEVFLVTVAGTFMDPHTVLSHGPLTLVDREAEQDGGRS